MRGTAPLRLYVLDGGTIVCDDYELFDPRVGPGVTREMTVRSYLVVHPEGTLLFDTGLPDDLAVQESGRDVLGAFHYRVTRPLAAQLEALGFSPDGIDRVALSHLHDDHVGNVSLFPHATLVTQRAELDAAFGAAPERFHYQPHTYAGLDALPVQPVVGDHDVFGDRRVVLLSLPGHTPGHQGLLVDLDQTGPIVLGADIAHSMGTLEAEVMSEAQADHAEATASMRRLGRLAGERRAKIWLHHDAAQQVTIPLAPVEHR